MGSKNRYDGINEYAVRIISYRAKRLIGTAGYTPADVEDIEQDLMLDLIERLNKYDAAKAKLTTFIDRIVDHKIANLLAERRAAKRDLSKTFTNLDTPFEGHDGEKLTLLDITGTDDYLERMGFQNKPAQEAQDIQIDLDTAIQRLSDDERQLLDLLQVKTLTEAAHVLGKKRTTLAYHVKRIHKTLKSMGLNDAWRS